MSNDTLFPELEAEYQNKLVWQGTTSNFTKAQKDFNDALNKHKDAMLRVNEIEEYIALADKAYYNEIIPELNKQTELERKKLEVMIGIYLSAQVKLGKNQKESLRQLIIEECYDKLNDDRTFYFNLIKQIETTAERNQRLGLKNKAEKQIKNKFGVDVDIDELNKSSFSSDEERAAHKEKFKDFFEKYHQQYSNNEHDENDFFGGRQFNGKEKKKSKTQEEKEHKLAEAEKLLNTDINKLFKDLAKLIHPDREQDPVMRDKKEVLMKELSNARDNMNIAEILRVKMLVDDLIPNNQTAMTFNDATIRRFVTIIKTKIKELESTIEQKLYAHPLLENVRVKFISIELIKNHIKSEIKSVKNETLKNEKINNLLVNNPKVIKDIIIDYQEMNDFNVFW